MYENTIAFVTWFTSGCFVDAYVSNRSCKYHFYKKVESSHALSCSFKFCFWRIFRRRHWDKRNWNLFSVWFVCGSPVPSLNTIPHLSHWTIPHKCTVSVGLGGRSAPRCASSCLPLTTSHLFCATRRKMSITDVLSADDIAAALQECQGKGQWGRGGWFPPVHTSSKAAKIKTWTLLKIQGIRE